MFAKRGAQGNRREMRSKRKGEDADSDCGEVQRGFLFALLGGLQYR